MENDSTTGTAQPYGGISSTEDLVAEASIEYVPDVGEIFEYCGRDARREPRRYRVKGWLRLRPWRADAFEMAMSGALCGEFGCPGDDVAARVIADLLQEDGPRPPVLEHCLRQFATHVIGCGVCGCRAPIDRIRVVGKADLPNEVLLGERDRAIKQGKENAAVF